MIFESRFQGGKLLGEKLIKYRNEKDFVIIALARGGVEVGVAISEELHLPLEILVVRKLGVPMDEELAMGAVTQDGESLVNEEVMRSYQVTDREFEIEKKRQLEILKERTEKYLGDRKNFNLKNKNIILTDDGIATGSTVKVAINYLRKKEVKKIILAVPVAPTDTVQELKRYVDEAVILHVPEQFQSVGQFYEIFNQVSDEEVIEYMKKALR